MARTKRKTTKNGRATPTKASPTSRKKIEQKNLIENKTSNEQFKIKVNATTKIPWQLKDPPQAESRE